MNYLIYFVLITLAIATLQPEFEKQAKAREEERKSSSASVGNRNNQPALTVSHVEQQPSLNPNQPTENSNAQLSQGILQRLTMSIRQFGIFNFNSQRLDATEKQLPKDASNK